MQTNLFTIVLVLLCALAATLYAATREWSVPVNGQVFQVVADGKGGCAFVWVSGSSTGTVVWVDKKGAVKYQKAVVLLGPYSGIIKCTKKELVFVDASGQSVIVQVDKKNQTSEISEPGKLLLGAGYPYPASIPADKKGFFALSVDTNSPMPAFELIRYSDK
jgi:hypothetical protein